MVFVCIAKNKPEFFPNKDSTFFKKLWNINLKEKKKTQQKNNTQKKSPTRTKTSLKIYWKAKIYL